jgi:DNA-binding XRE family transcriptional regulator
MRRGFDRVDRDIRDARTELHGDIGATRAELTAQIEALRQTMIRIGGGMLLGFISVLAAILARGA